MCNKCIFETKEYQEALVKAKKNNPYLFKERERVNKSIKKLKALSKMVDVIVFGSLAVLVGTLIYVIAKNCFSVEIAYFLILFVLISGSISIFRIPVETELWRKFTRKDIKLYEEEKIEFAKVGYKLP